MMDPMAEYVVLWKGNGMLTTGSSSSESSVAILRSSDAIWGEFRPCGGFSTNGLFLGGDIEETEAGVLCGNGGGDPTRVPTDTEEVAAVEFLSPLPFCCTRDKKSRADLRNACWSLFDW